MNDDTSTIEPSGERYIPTLMTPDVAVEHWHRYAIAQRLVAGKRVLDIASGEGYGSLLLADVAAHVLGVDIDEATVAEARRRYLRDNLAFAVGSCAAMPLADASVDVVVSFETLEHHDQHEEMFREIRRVLVPGGLCIVSTPDRVVYSERTGYRNPFHVLELSDPEFRDLMARHFAHSVFLGQKYVRGSLLTGADTSGAVLAYHQDSFALAPRDVPLDPKYLVALSSDAPLPAIPVSFLEDESDAVETARLTGLLQELATQVQALIVDRDAYKAALEERTAAATPPTEQARIIATLRETVANLVAERDIHKSALEERTAADAARFTEQGRIIATLREAVASLIKDRDAYKSALEERSASADALQPTEQGRIIAMLQETVENLIVDRDAYKSALEASRR